MIETHEVPLPENAIGQGQILFVQPCLEMETIEGQRIYFHELAIGLERFLRTHMPQGLYDHLFAVMALRQASTLIVTVEQECDIQVDRDCSEIFALMKAVDCDYSFQVVDSTGVTVVSGLLEMYGRNYFQVGGRTLNYLNISRFNINRAQRYVEIVKDGLVL